MKRKVYTIMPTRPARISTPEIADGCRNATIAVAVAVAGGVLAVLATVLIPAGLNLILRLYNAA